MAVLVLLSACGASSPETAAPDRIVAGPQGRVGQFVVECDLSHLASDDPIVHPGRPGASHLHQFFGATGVRAESRYDELIAGDTTCHQRLDTASYWTPALVDDAQNLIEPHGAVAYYRAGPGVEPESVQPYPPGLMMVAGDHLASEPQPLSVVAWSCGVGSARAPTPPDCAGAPSLRMTVTFADCWNGAQLRSPVLPEPSLHVAYSRDGACPSEFPVAIPQLQLAIDYPPVDAADLGALALSSGDIITGHADFWNAWDQTKLTREVEGCIHRDLACGVAG